MVESLCCVMFSAPQWSHDSRTFLPANGIPSGRTGVFVMMVVPTTILADQHYIFFQNRLKRFGVSVEMISRFVKTKKQKEIIDLIDDKRVDILVGTHKLLSDNFRNFQDFHRKFCQITVQGCP